MFYFSFPPDPIAVTLRIHGLGDGHVVAGFEGGYRGKRRRRAGR